MWSKIISGHKNDKQYFKTTMYKEKEKRIKASERCLLKDKYLKN